MLRLSHCGSLLCALGLFAPLSLAIGCGGSEEAAAPDGAVESGVDAAPDTVVVVDSAIDTFVPHTPKAPRCVASDSDVDPDTGADSAAVDSAIIDSAIVDSALVDGALVDSAIGDGTIGDGSDGPDAATDAAPDAPPTYYPPVQAVTNGGPVLRHAHIVPITYDGDDNRDDMEDFSASFGCTSWWRAVGREYGVLDANSGTPIHIADKPPATISDLQIEKWLRTNISAKTPGWEMPTPETVYAIWYTPDTLVKLGTIQSCSGFGGFHKNFKLSDGTPVAYAVMVDCGGDLTGTTSHEFIEAATDPFPASDPAYTQADDDHAVYWFRLGGEVGDLCETQQAGGLYLPSDYPFVVQRSWSNVAALAGHDPCVPSQVPVYFNTIPELPDTVSLTVYGSGRATKGIKMAIGETKTINLQLVADGPIIPWNVTVKDASYESPHLSFKLDKGTGKAGDTIALTITKKSESASIGAEPFSITSNNGKTRFTSYGVVGHVE